MLLELTDTTERMKKPDKNNRIRTQKVQVSPDLTDIIAAETTRTKDTGGAQLSTTRASQLGPRPTTEGLMTTVPSVSLCGLWPHPAPGRVPWPGHFVGHCLVTWKTQPQHNGYIHYQD